MQVSIRRWFTTIEHRDAADEPPLRKAAAVAIVENPYAGRKVENLAPLIAASAELGSFLSKTLVAAMAPYGIESYGKGGIVGLAGEQEHVNGLVTTTFAEPLRAAIGGGKAWIASFTKRAPPGHSIDIPLAHKDALYVRSHYDGMTVSFADSPMPDEIAVIICVANRGRIGARVGGLKAEEILGQDGLR
jgi:hypothetical protein